MTTSLEPGRVRREAAPPVEKRPGRRGSLWPLVWTASLFVLVIAAVVVGFVTSTDDEPVWTSAELQEIADTYAGDIVDTTPTLSPQMQTWLAGIGSSYSGDLTDMTPTLDRVMQEWMDRVAASYAGDIVDTTPTLAPDMQTWLQSVADSYAGDIVEMRPAVDPAIQTWMAEVGATYYSDIAGTD